MSLFRANHGDLEAGEIPSARVQRGRRPSVIAAFRADSQPSVRRLELGRSGLGIAPERGETAFLISIF